MDHSKPQPAAVDHSKMDHGPGGAPMNMAPGNAATSFLLGQSSGTAFQPKNWPMPMLMSRAGSWNLMWMGQGFVAATQQGGPRGADKIYSANWGMLSAAHTLGGGAIMFRSMISLEPVTVRGRSYPLLFQSGETAYGKPVVDGQHPHDMFMELSAQYAHSVKSLGESGMFNAYYAAMGDPAMGPVAFPHRASAMEIPQAALSHHWQDSTHIATNVLTAGIGNRWMRVEASGFHGREPDENRWNINKGAMDSWSSRISLFPTGNWSGQLSLGRFKNPEATHAGDVVRTTASLHHVAPRGNGNSIATSVIWGRNYKTAEQHAVHAILAETVVPFRRRNFVTGRFEWSQRDELGVAGDHDDASHGARAFQVAAFTAGYTRDLWLTRNGQVGVGANLTTYATAHDLEPAYGAHPVGVTVFIRLRLRRNQ
jgi:hypothetical protein